MTQLKRSAIAGIEAGGQVWKAANFTTTQTGGAIWTPTTGRKIAITRYVLSAYGTTAGRVILWFGASADTTYSAGTDQLLTPASFAPSSTVKAGIAENFGDNPVYCANADYVLRITTDAAMSIDVVVYGFEWS